MLYAVQVVDGYETVGFVVSDENGCGRTFIHEFEECQVVEKMSDAGLVEIEDDEIDILSALESILDDRDDARESDFEDSLDDETSEADALID